MISPIKNEFQLVNVVQLEPWKRHKMDNVFAKINSLVGLALNVLTVTKEPVVINAIQATGVTLVKIVRKDTFS